jgi:glutamate-1-semialdehyde 2,1-aminomutase
MSDKFLSSRAQFERARRSLAGGVATAFRALQEPVPLSFRAGRGARLWDIDGNEYVDYALGFGPMLLGHSPDPVVKAVSRQLEAGIGFGASHELEAELAEAVCRTVPSAELCAFTSTGSEAVQAAIRVARAATGRNRVVKFLGHYHGWLDSVHVGVPGQAWKQAGTAGQDPAAADAVTVCPWNDPDALAAAVDTDVAAVIMEPAAANCGALAPRPGYLEQARELASRAGAVLIFDEVITGYRLALGGAQQVYGVTPDLTVLGKALGSGFPISAVCGRADVMAVVADRRVSHVGTFNANPVSASAAIATITELENDAGLYARLESCGARLAELFRGEASAAGLPVVINQIGAAAYGFMSDSGAVTTYADALDSDAAGYRQFARALLEEGVHVIPRGLLYSSTAHEDADLELTRAAVRKAAMKVARERAQIQAGQELALDLSGIDSRARDVCRADSLPGLRRVQMSILHRLCGQRLTLRNVDPTGLGWRSLRHPRTSLPAAWLLVSGGWRGRPASRGVPASGGGSGRRRLGVVVSSRPTGFN